MIDIDIDIKGTDIIIKMSCMDTYKEMREHFSITNTSAAFVRRRSKFTPSRKYAITPGGKCGFGMFYEIKKWLIDNQIICNFNLSDRFKSFINSSKKHDYIIPTDDSFLGQFAVQLRDYQIEVLNRAFEYGHGTCVLGTGAGKTILTAALIERFYKKNQKDTFKCLVVVPDIGLVDQTFNEFVSCGSTFSVCRWTGSHPIDISANAIICNAQILHRQFAKYDWIKDVDLLIVDECHKAKHGNEINDIISKIKTSNRFGLTGTLPDNLLDNWTVISKFGPVIYEKNSFSLREENYLVNVFVKAIKLSYKESVPYISANKYKNELSFIYNNKFRNKTISEICNKINNNTLILVNHIEHGEKLLDILKRNTQEKDVFFIQGSVDVEDREKIKQRMEQYNNIICIAMSSIFSTGVNIKNLHYIIFAAGGKSFIRTVQSIGRGLRKNDNKEKLIIFDIVDNLKYGIIHYTKRTAIYDQEKIRFDLHSITES